MDCFTVGEPTSLSNTPRADEEDPAVGMGQCCSESNFGGILWYDQRVNVPRIVGGGVFPEKKEELLLPPAPVPLNHPNY